MWSENLTFLHSILWLFITPDSWILAHRKWSGSATGRGGGCQSDPQHVNQAFLWGSATLEDEMLLLWKKTVERYTCHNTWGWGAVGVSASILPWCRGSRLPSWPEAPPTLPPSSCSSSSLSLSCTILRFINWLVATLLRTIKRGPRWSS